jgi:hypothetical protein
MSGCQCRQWNSILFLFIFKLQQLVTIPKSKKHTVSALLLGWLSHLNDEFETTKHQTNSSIRYDVFGRVLIHMVCCTFIFLFIFWQTARRINYSWFDSIVQSIAATFAVVPQWTCPMFGSGQCKLRRRLRNGASHSIHLYTFGLFFMSFSLVWSFKNLHFCCSQVARTRWFKLTSYSRLAIVSIRVTINIFWQYLIFCLSFFVLQLCRYCAHVMTTQSDCIHYERATKAYLSRFDTASKYVAVHTQEKASTWSFLIAQIQINDVAIF